MKKIRTQEEANEKVKRNVWLLKYVPEKFKTKEMCDEAVERCVNGISGNNKQKRCFSSS